MPGASTLRFALGWLVLATATSCAGQPPPRQSATTATLPAPKAVATTPGRLVEFVPSKRALEQAERAGFKDGAILEGVRVSRDGRAMAGSVAREALKGGVVAPAWAGSGYWFYGGKSVYRAGQFLAPLEPKLRLQEVVTKLAFGPDFLLIGLAGGGIVFVNPKSLKLKRPPVVGMYDVATLPDGRAIGFGQPGMTWTRAASKAAKWRNVTQHLSGDASSLRSADGQLWLLTTTDVFRVERDGSLARFASRPKLAAKTDPRWPDSRTTPIEYAVRNGISISDRLALVLVKGRVAKIALPGGEITEISQPVLPTDADCTLLPQRDDVIAACRGRNGLFAASGLTSKPKLERAFGKLGYFVSGGAGTLAFAGGCQESSSSEIRVCVRSPQGKWDEVRAPSAGANPGETRDASNPPLPALAPINVARIAIGPSGHVLALISSPKAGLFDLMRGRFTAFDKGGWRTVSALFRPPRRKVLADNIQVDARGNLVGYQGRTAFSLSADGQVTPSVHSFSSLTSAGANALAFDRDGQAWQSLDYGRSFAHAAPWPARRGRRARGCSHAGCDLGFVYRLGWRSNHQGPPVLTEAPEPPALPLPGLARLSCKPEAAPKVKLAAPRIDSNTDEALDALGLGAKRFPLRRGQALTAVTGPMPIDPTEMTRALWLRNRQLLETEGPQLQALLRRPATIHYAQPFGTDARVRSSQILWHRLLQGAARTRLNSPRLNLDALVAVEGFSAYFVSGHTTTATELALTDNEQSVFVLQEGRPAEIHPAFGDEDEGELLSLARNRAGKIVGLFSQGVCDAQVHELAGAAKQVFSLPERLSGSCSDQQALAVKGEEFRVIQYSPSLPPTSFVPAHLLVPGQPAIPLAAWSTITPASAAACKDHAGYRVTLSVDARWLDVVLAQSDVGDLDDWFVLQGTWGQDRFCLEAVEAAAPFIETDEEEVPTRIVAHFGANSRAARIALEQGAEAVQPLSCTLQPRP